MTTTVAATADDLCTIVQEPSRFNDEFGEMSPRAKIKVKGEMSEFVQKFIQPRPSW